MPNMTGAELAKELRCMKPDIPIILCTGYSETVSENEAKAMGFDLFRHSALESAELLLRNL